MKNSATDRIRAKLTNPPEGSSSDSDTGVQPNPSGSATGAVTIDEAYLSSLFGNRPDPAVPEASRTPAAKVESVHREEPVPVEEAVAFETPAFEDTETGSSERDLFAFHSALTETVENEVEAAEPELPAVPPPVAAKPQPVISARTETVLPTPAPKQVPPSSNPETSPATSTNKDNRARVVRVTSVPVQRAAPKVVHPEKKAAQGDEPQDPPPPVQNKTQSRVDATPRQAPPPPETRAEARVAQEIPAFPPPVADSAPGLAKNKNALIAAGVVVLLGAGIGAKFFFSGSSSPTPQTQVSAQQPATGSTEAVPPPPGPGNAPVAAVTAPITQPAVPSSPPANTPTSPTDKSATNQTAAATIQTQPQQPANANNTAVRAAPKQFVAPTAATPRTPTITNLAADAAPEVGVNVQGGSISLPSATNIPARVLAPPPPSAPKQDTPAQAVATPPPAQAKQQTATLTRIKTVAPVYPSAARTARISGVVVMSVTVGKDGKVTAVKPISGQPMLVPAAKNAVSQWVYNPPTINGQPTEATTQVELNFALN